MARCLAAAFLAAVVSTPSGVHGEALASCNDTRVVVAYHVYSKRRKLEYEYGKNFTESLFAHEPKDQRVEFRYLPPVQSEACGEAAFKRKKTIFDPARGSILTHINVWDHFWRRRRKHCEGNSTHPARANVDQDVVMIFEHDAFVAHPDAGKLALKAARTMTTGASVTSSVHAPVSAHTTPHPLSFFAPDLHYLGYCYTSQHPLTAQAQAAVGAADVNLAPATPTSPPLCVHAYAMTIKGTYVGTDSLLLSTTTSALSTSFLPFILPTPPVVHRMAWTPPPSSSHTRTSTNRCPHFERRDQRVRDRVGRRADGGRGAAWPRQVVRRAHPHEPHLLAGPLDGVEGACVGLEIE